MFLAALAATAQTRMSVDSCMRYAANHNLDVRAARISLSDSRLASSRHWQAHCRRWALR